MNNGNTYNLFKIELPNERKEDQYATIGLESFLITCFPKSLWYSEKYNSILLDVQESPTEFHKTVQNLCTLPSGGFNCELRKLEEHELNSEEKKWLDERLKIRKDLFETILPNFKNDLPYPTFHLLTLESISKV